MPVPPDSSAAPAMPSVKADAPAVTDSPEREWVVGWLSSVADGRSTMSQRKLSSIEKRAGSLDLVRSVAEQLQVHLLQLTDDRGDVLVAASRHAFKVIA